MMVLVGHLQIEPERLRRIKTNGFFYLVSKDLCTRPLFFLRTGEIHDEF